MDSDRVWSTAIELDVGPEATAFDEKRYTVRLRGTALLSGEVRAWVKQHGSGDPSSGSPAGTSRVLWKEGRHRDPVEWNAVFWIRKTPQGLVLQREE